MNSQSAVFGISSIMPQFSLIGIGLNESWRGMMDEIGDSITPGEVGTEEMEGKNSSIGDNDAYDECSAFYIGKVGKDNKKLTHKYIRASVGEVG